MLLPEHMTENELLQWGRAENEARLRDLEEFPEHAKTRAALRRNYASLTMAQASWAVGQAQDHLRRCAVVLRGLPGPEPRQDGDNWRIVDCEACYGSGRETVYHSPRQGEHAPCNERDLGPCQHCDGNGTIELETQPVEIDDEPHN